MHKIDKIRMCPKIFWDLCAFLASSFALRLCVFALVLFSISFAQRQGMGWVWQNPIPQGNHLNSIHFAKDRLNGDAVGSDSSIVRSIIGGFGWMCFGSLVF